MRRKQNEVVDNNKMDDIILSCECLRLGLIDGKSVYIVPVNFGFSNENGKRIFYFHGVNVGKKKDLIVKNGYAGFELDTKLGLIENELACEYSYAYQSVIGNGPIEEITDITEKRRALDVLMKHYTNKDGFEYPDAVVQRLFVFKLIVDDITCKENKNE
jgi:uncharacterized protein